MKILFNENIIFFTATAENRILVNRLAERNRNRPAPKSQSQQGVQQQECRNIGNEHVDPVPRGRGQTRSTIPIYF